MNTHKDPKEIARALCRRSDLRSFQHGAVLFDGHGVFAWGWSNFRSKRSNEFRTLCAERHALQRANKRRLGGALLVVAGIRRKSGTLILSKPCALCEKAIREAGIKTVIFSDQEVWRQVSF